MRAAWALALSDRWALIGGITLALLASVFFVVGGQMFATGNGGLVLIATPAKLAVFVVLAVLSGVAASSQIAAMRIRLTGTRRGGAAGAAGILLAFLGASCCTPLIWPAVLSFFGVSGVTLLGINITLHRWFWPAVAFAALSLLFGIATTARAMAVACRTNGLR